MRSAEEQKAPDGGRGAGPAPGRLPGVFGDTDELLRRFLDEDVGPGDVTSEALIDEGIAARGSLRVKAEGVLAGVGVFARVFELLDPQARVRLEAADGESVERGRVVCRVEARARALLVGERTALNLVQRLSGIATLTRRFVAAAGEGAAGIYDTRKTTPGLRRLEKYAVTCGGGRNHRSALWDEAMIKNNHVDVARRGLRDLVGILRERHGQELVIHAEARDEAEALAAAEGGADVVLLDNMDVERMRALCPRIRAAARGRKVAIEASGGVDLDTVGAIARCGVDRVSVGALTHSAPALDLSLAIERVER